MIKRDKELMVTEMKEFFKEEYHDMLKKLGDNDIQQLWDILNGRKQINPQEGTCEPMENKDVEVYNSETGELEEIDPTDIDAFQRLVEKW